jgi:putative tRNA adenosine deaminase-associated protein
MRGAVPKTEEAAMDTLVDFAVVVFREDGQWQVGALPHRAAETLEGLVAAVRQQPTEGPRFALSSYGDDFFLAVRPEGEDTRLFLSDGTAADEWPIAAEVLDALDVDTPDTDDDEAEPSGDVAIFGDLGMTARELTSLCSDLELYPDEVLTQVASRIGFGPQFERVMADDLT